MAGALEQAVVLKLFLINHLPLSGPAFLISKVPMKGPNFQSCAVDPVPCSVVYTSPWREGCLREGT